MKYLPLGNSGLYISNLTMGTMTFARPKEKMGQMLGATGEKLAERMVNMALDAGINIFDTANMYDFGHSEEMLAKALGNRRKDVLIATKVYFPFGTRPNDLGTSRLAIMREVENSLKRLNTDYIDLYQLHSFDATTPLEETLRTLDDLVRQGKVRYIGISNFSGWQLTKAAALSREMGSEKFISLQAYYSLVGRELEHEIIPAMQDAGMGLLVWSPLAGGFLSGKYTRESETSGRRKTFAFPPVNHELGYSIVDVLQEIAQSHNRSVAQIALSWLLHKKAVSSVIVGARTEKQLADNLQAADIPLSAEEMERLDKISAIPPQYPNWLMPLQRGESPFGALE